MTTLGVLYPGHAAEDDYPAAGSLLQPAVEFVVVHTPDEPSNSIEDARRTGEAARLLQGVHEIRARSAVLHRRVGAVLWACTAGSFVFGLEGARAQARQIAEAACVPATSTSLAFVDACRALGVRRVAVAATYPADEAALFAAFLAEGGIEVISIDAAGIEEGSGGSLLSDDAVVALAVAADRREADAILLPDTAVRTMRILGRLETAAAKPVLSANQVTIWAGLRVIGAFRPQEGLGSLFRVALPATHPNTLAMSSPSSCPRFRR